MAEGGERPVVLVVDDEPMVRDVLEQYLSREGTRTTSSHGLVQSMNGDIVSGEKLSPGQYTITHFGNLFASFTPPARGMPQECPVALVPRDHPGRNEPGRSAGPGRAGAAAGTVERKRHESLDGAHGGGENPADSVRAEHTRTPDMFRAR
jgi:hypothetical protein